MNIGKTIAQLRKENNMTQSEVADQLGVSYQAVSKWERDESLPDITLLPQIADLFGITIDQLLRGGLEMKDEEVQHAKEIVEQVNHDELNEKISEFVSKEMEEGYINGDVPTSDELADKISKFVTKTMSESFSNAFENLMPLMKPKKIKKLMKNYNVDLNSFSADAYEYFDAETLNQLLDSIDEIDEDIYDKLVEIIPVCDSTTRDKIVEKLCESELESLEISDIMPFINSVQKTKILSSYFEQVENIEQIEELLPFLNANHKNMILDYVIENDVDQELIIDYLPFLNSEHKNRIVDWFIEQDEITIDLEDILVFLNKNQKRKLLSCLKDTIDMDTILECAPFLDSETIQEYIMKYIEEELDDDISELYPFMNQESKNELMQYYIENKMTEELGELFLFMKK